MGTAEFVDGGNEKAILVKLVRPVDSPWEVDESMLELARLVESAGGTVVGRVRQYRRRQDPACYVGRGKVQEIRGAVEGSGCDLVVFDEDLSPTQAKNLERLIGVRILDRSELILDIFAIRARTAQAKLQVELAQLQYLLPRLTRMWEHLSRIRGGIGLRGPGETQLELDRRVVRRRIGRLVKQLDILKKRRHQQRRRRSRGYNIALVGYTNAGKSTLFNRLTNGRARVGDRLFETLDARTRAVDLGSSRAVLITDTVGFIRKLPHHLIASFRATLEEVVEGDLLVHVIDISSEGVFDEIRVVGDVLSDLGVDGTPTIRVFNKIDRAEGSGTREAMRLHYPGGIFLSALEGTGIDRLRGAIGREMMRGELLMEFSFPSSDARSLSRLYASGRVLDRTSTDGNVRVRMKIRPQARERLLKEGISGILLE